MRRRVLLSQVVLVCVVGAACNDATEPDSARTITGSVERVDDEPWVEGTIGSLLVRHVVLDPNVGGFSIVHIQEETTIHRAGDHATVELELADVVVGAIGRFHTTGYEKRTNPRQVIATRIEITDLPDVTAY